MFSAPGEAPCWVSDSKTINRGTPSSSLLRGSSDPVFLTLELYQSDNRTSTNVWVVDFPGSAVVRTCLPMQEKQETQVLFLGWENPLEQDMANYPSILAWKIPWTEEPGGQQSMGSQRVSHD